MLHPVVTLRGYFVQSNPRFSEPRQDFRSALTSIIPAHTSHSTASPSIPALRKIRAGGGLNADHIFSIICSYATADSKGLLDVQLLPILQLQKTSGRGAVYRTRERNARDRLGDSIVTCFVEMLPRSLHFGPPTARPFGRMTRRSVRGDGME